MLGSNVLDTAVGLVLVYCLLSLMVSAANEAVATILQWRSATLLKGLKNLLGNPPQGGLFDQLMAHSLIQGLSPDGKPSYIPARNFALALLDIVFPEHVTTPVFNTQFLNAAVDQRVADPRLNRAIKSLMAGAGGDFQKGQQMLEGWFNDAMDRVSGWYKRRILLLSFLTGLALTVVLNADTLGLIRQIYNNAAIRTSLTQIAQSVVEPPAAPTDNADSSRAPDPANPPASADPLAVQRLLDQANQFPSILGDWSDFTAKAPSGAWVTKKILGLFLTALALSLGASFWFDALGKLASLRGAGNKPAVPRPEGTKE